MTRSFVLFFVGFIGAVLLSEHCASEKRRRRAAAEAADTPRPGAHVPLAPDAGTIEASALGIHGATIESTTSTADVETPAVFTPPTNA